MKRTTENNKGFTLLELLVSMAIFTVVGGVALGLVGQAMPLYNRQQGTTALNIGLRSAVSQIEQDVVNAGTGYYTGGTYPDWPVGVSILKPTGTCYDATTHVYSAGCFDTLNVITTDLTVPFGVLGGAGNILSNNATLTVNVPTSIDPATGLAWTAPNYAAKFPSGSQILLLTGGTSNNQYTSFLLNANATGVSGATFITLTHNATNTDSASLTGGTNGAGAGHYNALTATNDVACSATAAPSNDPLGITMCANNKLTSTFTAGNAWVFKLATVTYAVDASDTTNPKLTRRSGAGSAEVVAEQIIGFRIGVGLWNNGNGVDDYNFEPSTYHDMSSPWVAGVNGFDPYNYTRVRSVRASLIGRTTPSTDPTNSFRNTFDSGRYQIQAVSVVVNPRNLSMRDN